MGKLKEEVVFGCCDQCTMQGMDHPLMGGGGDNDVRLLRLHLDRFRILSLPTALAVVDKMLAGLRDFSCTCTTRAKNLPL